MKKTIIISVLLVFAFLFTACGQKDTNDLNVQKKLKEVEKEVSSKDASYWPDWIPSEIPPYTYGDYAMESSLEEEGGMIYFSNLDIAKDPFNSYIADLQEKGWEAEIVESDIVGELAYLDHPKGYFLSYSVDEETDWVILTMDLEENDSQEKTKEEPSTRIIENEEVNMKITQSNEKLPAGYSEELCPLYQPSEFISGQDGEKLDGSEGKLYSIALSTKDSFQKVFDFYKSLKPQSTSIIAPDIMATFMLGDNENFDNYLCQINIIYDEETSETAIGITLSVHEG